jgi:hypothetical protein
MSKSSGTVLAGAILASATLLAGCANHPTWQSDSAQTLQDVKAVETDLKTGNMAKLFNDAYNMEKDAVSAMRDTPPKGPRATQFTLAMSDWQLAGNLFSPGCSCDNPDMLDGLRYFRAGQAAWAKFTQMGRKG